MQSLPSLRLAAALNSLAGGSTAGEGWIRAVVGSDVAHHVADPDQLLGLDPTRSAEVADALPRLVDVETECWVLALPVPGALGGLRGPKDLNMAALDKGEAVVAVTAGLALVPYRVGPAVQWRVFAAEPPLLPPSPYEAERELAEAVLRAGATLQRLDVAAGTRPAEVDMQLPASYPTRQRLAADRAARLLLACETALADDGSALSSYEADLRSRELRAVRDAARTALSAAVTWHRIPDEASMRSEEDRRRDIGVIAGRRKPPNVSA